MRLPLLAGLLLILAGGFVLLFGVSYRSEKAAMRVGGFKASVEEKREVPRWLGAVVVAGGLILILADRRGAR